MPELLSYLLLGAFAGTLAGLLGVGGGLVIVPVVALILEGHGVVSEVVMHLAIGTSLATIVLTSLSSVRAHQKRGAVEWPAVVALAPGIVAGSFAGSFVVDTLSGPTLKTLFGLFELAVAAQMGFGAKPSPHRQLPGRAAMAGAGLVIGLVSALVGIGGGTLTVPFLVWCNTPMRRAVATSAACGLPIALAGAAGFLVAGWSNPSLPQGSIGYLYLPALAGIAAASVLFAPLGARLAHSVPAEGLKRFFALFLAVLGVRMLLG